jgi:adenosylhomocysteine nucleosidase
VDLTAFGYEVGQLPANPAAFLPNATLIAAANKGIEQLNQSKEQNIKAVLGLITTGDTFMTKEDDVAKARANFPTMAAVEMEGAAIAQACLQLNTPFVVIRSLSDIAGKESPHTFEEYLQTAAVNSSELVLNMLAQLQGHSSVSMNS